ncbi:hypothetical protein DCS_06024 [Drechmeria coniospora]|uniref:Uncharacterized protein n=1 Tax=Drechmeria coniospora TaxID=98403 RepID=A0A151GAG5_DRECN|nr:hypothetical protein DCS_06024 [Drechmeria coniospora]KYK54068.1 hypothetical protein DCS_06024 [Drechmeria coniospora]
MADTELPIALRRPRRSHVGHEAEQDTVPASPASLIRTPRRQKRTVRFSDPGPSLTANGTESTSSGLTPMVRRTSLGTPKRQRASTPTRSRPAASTERAAAQSSGRGRDLHHTADGRVERRVRRGNLRTLLLKLEEQRKRGDRRAQEEIQQLRAEVKSRDREIYELQNATVVVDTERIWSLEQQIEHLEDALGRRPEVRNDGDDWTLAARDPFSDDFIDVTADELMDTTADDGDDFGDDTMAHLTASTPCKTPSRALSSFPTPPATSPATPLFGRCTPPVTAPEAGVQTSQSLADATRQQLLEEETASLMLEVSRLTATLESYRDLGARLTQRLSSVVAAEETPSPGLDAPLDGLERRVEALVRTMSDGTAKLGRLGASIAALGFPGDDAGDMIASLGSGLRTARLELEYLTPGEVALPLTAHGAEVLDLLLGRLRTMAKRQREDEATIDEYHDIERCLRRQLDARVSAMDGLRGELAKAEERIGDGEARVEALEVANHRLRGAVDGYVRDMGELERLVERLDEEGREARETQDERRKEVESRDGTIATLEAKLASALDRTTSLQGDVGDMERRHRNQLAALDEQHGAALALRDARVLELGGELDGVQRCLRAAHETIHGLRLENGGLASRTDEEKKQTRRAVDSIRQGLRRVLRMSHALLPQDDGDISGHEETGEEEDADV